MFKVTCGKCNGTGVVECFRYHDAGACYDCNGKGFNMRKTKPLELYDYEVTAIVKEGYRNAGERKGVFVSARTELAAMKKAKLSPDGYLIETIQVVKVDVKIMKTHTA